MNSDQIFSLIRGVLLSLGTALTYHGVQLFSTEQWQAVVGAVVIVASVAWSQLHHANQ